MSELFPELQKLIKTDKVNNGRWKTRLRIKKSAQKYTFDKLIECGMNHKQATDTAYITYCSDAEFKRITEANSKEYNLEILGFGIQTRSTGVSHTRFKSEWETMSTVTKKKYGNRIANYVAKKYGFVYYMFSDDRYTAYTGPDALRTHMRLTDAYVDILLS